MRISDWSSDVCSSDLLAGGPAGGRRRANRGAGYPYQCHRGFARHSAAPPDGERRGLPPRAPNAARRRRGGGDAVTLLPAKTEDALLGGRRQLRPPEVGYRAASDPVLLAAAVPAGAGIGHGRCVERGGQEV